MPDLRPRPSPARHAVDGGSARIPSRSTLQAIHADRSGLFWTHGDRVWPRANSQTLWCALPVYEKLEPTTSSWRCPCRRKIFSWCSEDSLDSTLNLKSFTLTMELILWRLRRSCWNLCVSCISRPSNGIQQEVGDRLEIPTARRPTLRRRTWKHNPVCETIALKGVRGRKGSCRPSNAWGAPKALVRGQRNLQHSIANAEQRGPSWFSQSSSNHWTASYLLVWLRLACRTLPLHSKADRPLLVSVWQDLSEVSGEPEEVEKPETCCSLQLGQAVLIQEPNLSRGQWKIARITQVFPGKDGLVRVARVETEKGETYLRPVHRLCPLELESSTPKTP